MEPNTNGERIAVLEAEMKGLREQQKAHALEAKADIAALTRDVRELVAVMNKGKGAFGFAMLLAGTIGASAAAFVQAMLKH